MPILALSTSLLTSVDIVKEYLSASEFTDAKIERRIRAVSRLVENEMGRELGYRATPENEPEQYQGKGYAKLYLDRVPILDVTEVRLYSYGDDEGEEIEEEEGGYSRSPSFDMRGILFYPSGWPRSGGRHSDVARLPDLNSLAYNISVAYTAGFWLASTVVDEENPRPDGIPDLPADIEGVVIDEVVGSLRRPSSEAGSLQAETTPGGWMQKWDTSSANKTGISGDNLVILRKSPFYRPKGT